MEVWWCLLFLQYGCGTSVGWDRLIESCFYLWLCSSSHRSLIIVSPRDNSEDRIVHTHTYTGTYTHTPICSCWINTSLKGKPYQWGSFCMYCSHRSPYIPMSPVEMVGCLCQGLFDSRERKIVCMHVCVWTEMSWAVWVIQQPWGILCLHAGFVHDQKARIKCRAPERAWVWLMMYIMI